MRRGARLDVLPLEPTGGDGIAGVIGRPEGELKAPQYHKEAGLLWPAVDVLMGRRYVQVS